MDVFDRYAPFIQDYIYRSGWKALRGVQIAAGQAIFNSEDNVLLTASTASGKTEAAFFPMLTLLDEVPSQSVGILYIAPLKALINDQFGRISELCKDQGIPVYRWHGDAPASQKRKLLEHPSGILQITPESLESLMINKYMMIPALFGDLRFIVIDEIHSMLRGQRGMQTFCLIERLCRQAAQRVERIGVGACDRRRLVGALGVERDPAHRRRGGVVEIHKGFISHGDALLPRRTVPTRVVRRYGL